MRLCSLLEVCGRFGEIPIFRIEEEVLNLMQRGTFCLLLTCCGRSYTLKMGPYVPPEWPYSTRHQTQKTVFFIKIVLRM
jgi:hypothetical protein